LWTNFFSESSVVQVLLIDNKGVLIMKKLILIVLSSVMIGSQATPGVDFFAKVSGNVWGGIVKGKDVSRGFVADNPWRLACIAGLVYFTWSKRNLLKKSTRTTLRSFGFVKAEIKK